MKETRRPFFKTADWILIGGLLVVAAVAFLLFISMPVRSESLRDLLSSFSPAFIMLEVTDTALALSKILMPEAFLFTTSIVFPSIVEALADLLRYIP